MASVKMPTAAELAKVGGELGMNLSDSDIAFFQETFAGNVAAYNLLESLPDNLPAVRELRPHVMQVNGLYRHGFMIAPAMLDIALELLATGRSAQS